MPADTTLHTAMLTPGWPGGKIANGVVAYADTTLRALRRLGVDAHGISTHPSIGEPDPFITVLPRHQRNAHLWGRAIDHVMLRIAHDYWTRHKVISLLMRELRRLRREGRLDLVEMEESYGWPKQVARRCPAPVVVRLHGPWFLNGAAAGAPRDAAFAARDAAEGVGIGAAAGVTAPSRDVLEQVRSHHGLALPDAQVIPNSVAPVPESEQWRANDCEPETVLFIGRFDRHKGGDLVIDAFAQLAAERPRLRLLFVGDDRGFIDDAGKLWSLESYLGSHVADPDIRRRIELLGARPHAELGALRRGARLTLAPSRYETFGLALLEAMACGCPVLATRAGAIPEIVQEGRNGLLAASGDAASLAAQMRILLADLDLCARLGEQAQRDAAERYHPDVVARHTIEYYRSVIERAGVVDR
jgi:glycosyltransferase involved in cell wall biosynthesis